MDTALTNYNNNKSPSQGLPFSADQEDLIEDRRFEKLFEVEKVVGKGAYGEVYKAIHKLDKGVYAIKRVAIRESSKRSLEQTIEKVLREVSAMVALNHPSIVRYFTCWLEKNTADDQRSESMSQSQSASNFTWTSLSNPEQSNIHLDLFIQLEFCAGETLRHYLASLTSERNPVKMIEMFIKILEGVNTFHKAGILHRDLKPENIFLDASGNIKIGDFGLALNRSNLFSQNEGVSKLAQQKDAFLTSHVGTMVYMSPEIQNRLVQYDHKTDVYSLGCIFYEMLRVFKSDDEKYGALFDLGENRRVPEDFEQKYPEESAIILRMTSPNLQDRPSANELLNDIAHRKNFHDAKKYKEETAKVIGYNNKKSDPPAQTSSLLVENDRGIFTIAQGLKGDLATNPPALEKFIIFKFIDFDKKGLPANAIFKSLVY